MKYVVFLLIMIGQCIADTKEVFVYDPQTHQKIPYVRITTEGSSSKMRTASNFSADPSCYYRYGVVRQENCYKTSQRILLRFKDGSDGKLIDTIVRKYALSSPKPIDARHRTYVVFVPTALDIFELVNTINKENTNVYARIDWIRPRRLR